MGVCPTLTRPVTFSASGAPLAEVSHVYAPTPQRASAADQHRRRNGLRAASRAYQGVADRARAGGAEPGAGAARIRAHAVHRRRQRRILRPRALAGRGPGIPGAVGPGAPAARAVSSGLPRHPRRGDEAGSELVGRVEADRGAVRGRRRRALVPLGAAHQHARRGARLGCAAGALPRRDPVRALRAFGRAVLGLHHARAVGLLAPGPSLVRRARWRAHGRCGVGGGGDRGGRAGALHPLGGAAAAAGGGRVAGLDAAVDGARGTRGRARSLPGAVGGPRCAAGVHRVPGRLPLREPVPALAGYGGAAGPARADRGQRRALPRRPRRRPAPGHVPTRGSSSGAS
jgi:hypothetical protein